MAKAGFSIEFGPEWTEAQRWFAAFGGNYKRAVEKGTKKASQYILMEITNRLRGSKYKNLAPLTLLMRQLEGYSNIPLIRRGGLMRAITTDVLSYDEAHIGLLKQAPGAGKKAKDFSNIGKLLHDGGVIKITQAMRVAFMKNLGRLAQKRGVSLLNRRGSSKGYIRIPARRFIEEVFEDAAVMERVNQIYFETISQETGL